MDADLVKQTSHIIFYQDLVEEQLRELNSSRSRGMLRYTVFCFAPSCVKAAFPYSDIGYEILAVPKTQGDPYVLNKLINDGVLVELGEVNGVKIYTTLHGDIVFRVLRGRAYEDDLNGRWVGSFNIDFVDEYMPDFEAREISELEAMLMDFFKDCGVKSDVAKKVSEAIVEGLRRSGYSKLAVWQLEAIRNILLVKGRKYFIISAPTAAGKTLVFQTIAIVYSLLPKLLEYGGYKAGLGSVLIVYPRRALQKQQLGRLLRLLYHVNNKLKELGLKQYVVTVAIDSGVKPEPQELERIDLAIPCPASDKHTIYAIYDDRKGHAIRYECSGNEVIDFLIGIVYTRGDRENRK